MQSSNSIADDADIDLFRKMANPCHCIHSLLPPVKSCNHYLIPKGHTYALPRCDSEIHKKSFVPRCLFKYIQCFFYPFYVRFYHCMCIHFSVSTV